MMTNALARTPFPPVVVLYEAARDAGCVELIIRHFPHTVIVPTPGHAADFLPNSYTPWYLMRPAGRCRTCNRQWRVEADLVAGQCPACAAGVTVEAVTALAELGQ